MQLAVYAAILTGLSWGVATFAGGRAAKNVSPPLLTAIYNAVAGVIFATLYLLSDEHQSLSSSSSVSGNLLSKTIFFGTLGGLAFAVGLTAITFGLSKGRSAVVGPIASTIEVLIPFCYAVIINELPDRIAVVGILLLFFVPWLVTRSKVENTNHTTTIARDISLGTLSGVGFASYYLALIVGPESTPLLTMTIVQIASAISMTVVHIYLKRPWKIPSTHIGSAVIFVGFETLGALTLRYAISNGSPSVVATLSAIIYVASLLILSFIFVKERFSRLQILGFILTIAGVSLVVLNS
ncbi:MAG TPA: DMT family transporter [Acidimicrobiia bacterium]|nr:DMT family transporter [Acidimicrobiia bacterium]